MEDTGASLDIETWVGQSSVDQREFRQAVHVILCAIAHSSGLRERMIMKRGILLGLRYRSSRFTKDIDFSTCLTLNDLPPNEIREQFDRSLPLAVERLDYGLDCRVQKFEVRPPNEDATFPSLRLSIGYAYQGTPKHKRLMALSCPDRVSIDFSLNEPILNKEALSLGASNEDSILTYDSFFASTGDPQSLPTARRLRFTLPAESLFA
jgi:Nucleotidyl transferase AbiEii toxin, Type IV TA system